MPLHIRIGVYQCQAGTAEETLQRARETAYPLYHRQPGFVAYEQFLTEKDRMVSITTWETREQAAAASALDDAWITQHAFTTVSWVEEHVGSVDFIDRAR